MSDKPQRPYGRWADSGPVTVTPPPAGGYADTPAGKVRRAELRDNTGQVLGHLWTDDRQAAGFIPAEQAGAAGVRAGAEIWAILRDAHAVGIDAADLLDPDLYPDYALTLGTTP
ncbi:hypothetical protein [Microtetraspora niveoalba]|uniref:hypothetical protein n=1 Tax=Microtetraspora niveoalba TaxID=46175 RepID=UPI000A7D08FC|nr:hypothetical protein [Microtetraspora niveoalba]